MKLVYIAGPYSSDPESCVVTAIHAGHRVMDAGLYPYVPHLAHFMHQARERTYLEWLELDFEWLKVSDVLWRIPGDSPGADREVALAHQCGIPVAHSFEELVRLVVLDLRAQVAGLTEAREPEPPAQPQVAVTDNTLGQALVAKWNEEPDPTVVTVVEHL